MFIFYLFLILFVAMIVYLVWFQVFRSDSVISSPYNSRQDLYAEHVIRGDIVSGDGVVLATTEVGDDGSETRYYPFGRMFAHAVGYVNNGKSGIESTSNFQLLQSHSFIFSQISNDLTDKKNMGDTVATTLDYDVQEAAYYALGDNDGAVVVLEADTGKVLAMVSKPDYDPNTLAYEWDSIVGSSDNSVLLNRATSGLYPPGSVFKIFTTLEFVHENPDYGSYSYDCHGVLQGDTIEIHCYQNTAHGVENLLESFENSCNTSYATIGKTLDIPEFRSLLNDMFFNKSLPGSLAGAQSSFTLSKEDDMDTVMETAIGQGDTLVTPLHMAMIAAAIDQDGTVYAPYLVDHTEAEGGATVRRYRPTTYGSILSSSDAQLLQQYMSGVVQAGTGTGLSGQSYQAAGKTGSAEYDSEGNSHGWFVGYGSKEGYSDIAIAVIVEGGGSGSGSAVPVAKSVFDVYFNQ